MSSYPSITPDTLKLLGQLSMLFGGRIAEMVRRHRGEAVLVESPFGSGVDLEALREAVRAGPTKMVAVVHAETSTGVLQPLEPVADLLNTGAPEEIAQTA